MSWCFLRIKLEEQLCLKKEEYLQETARNCEELKKTVSEYEEKMSELQEKSTNSSENIETPRVKNCREKFIGI